MTTRNPTIDATPAGAQPRPLAAALWMVGSIAGFSALAVSGREIADALDTFEMMLYRSAIGFVVVVAALALSGRLGEVSARHIGLHAARNVIHFAGQNLWLYALALIPLAQLFALEFSSPLIVAILAPLLLAERLSLRRIAAVGLGFCGILIVARPIGTQSVPIGLVAALGCALAFALTAIATKRLTRVASVGCILFWLALMQTLLGLAFAGLDGRIALPRGEIVAWVVVMGLAGLLAHFSLTKALSLAPATIVTPMDFLRLPVIALVGALLYAEPLDPWVLLGGAVILTANWINLRA